MQGAPTSPRVIWDNNAWIKWNYMVQKAPGEISVLGEVEQNGAHFTIADVHLIKQTNGGASTSMDENAIGMFITEFIRSGKDTSRLRAWIHSHASMDVFWSGTDTGNIAHLGLASPWLVSVVTNKRENQKARIDVFRPFHLHIDDVPVMIDRPGMDEELARLLDEEIKEKCGSFTVRDNQVEFGFVPRSPNATVADLFDMERKSKSESDQTGELLTLEERVSEAIDSVDPALEWEIEQWSDAELEFNTPQEAMAWLKQIASRCIMATDELQFQVEHKMISSFFFDKCKAQLEQWRLEIEDDIHRINLEANGL